MATTRWPLVYAKPPVVFDEHAFDEFYVELDLVLARRRSYVVLVDLRGLQPSAERGGRFARWVARQEEALRKYMVALAYVATDEREREFLTATFWAMKQTFHARLFSEQSEAEDWLLTEHSRREAPNYA